MLEPVGRNTAPAIALAALHALTTDQDETLLVLAADHLIKDTAQFHQAIAKAEKLADEGHLVTFGIVPDCAHTGYGYIKAAKALGDCVAVEQFVEKPDLATAQKYVDSKEYFWNSGMFMFKASRYLEELEKHNPEMLAICKKAIESESKDLDFIRILSLIHI